MMPIISSPSRWRMGATWIFWAPAGLLLLLLRSDGNVKSALGLSPSSVSVAASAAGTSSPPRDGAGAFCRRHDGRRLGISGGDADKVRPLAAGSTTINKGKGGRCCSDGALRCRSTTRASLRTSLPRSPAVVATDALAACSSRAPTASHSDDWVTSSPQFRGGAIMGSLTDDNGGRSNDVDARREHQQTSRRRRRRRRRGMTAALFATYFAVMGSKCALPSTLNLLVAPDSGLAFPPGGGGGKSPQQIVARMLTLSTSAIAVGKFVLGPVIDRIGGTAALKLNISLLGALMVALATTGSFATFAACWVLVDFAFSAAWPACLNAVHQHFDEEEWGDKVGTLASAARTGNAAAFAFFSAVLQWASSSRTGGVGGGSQRRGVVELLRRMEPWRLVFLVSAAVQLVPLGLLFVFGGGIGRRGDEVEKNAVPASGRKPTASRPGDNEGRSDRGQEFRRKGSGESASTTTPRPPDTRASSSSSPLRVLRREAATSQFWLHLLSRSALMVYISFLLFVPTYVAQAYGMTSAQSARVGSVYALGCLTSVTLGSGRYAALSTRTRLVAAASMLGTCAACSAAQWAHVSSTLPRFSLSPSVGGAASMFLWGFASAVPFYVPPSLFALERGGKDSSATIADAFDVTGFGALALFNGYVAGIDHHQSVSLDSWRGTFACLTFCALLSLVSLTAAIAAEGRSKASDGDSGSPLPDGDTQ